MFMGWDWETISPLCCMAGEDMSEESKPTTNWSTIHPLDVHYDSIVDEPQLRDLTLGFTLLTYLAKSSSCM
jgi:hypothetical protein